MQKMITLVLSGVVQKYYGIQLLFSYHHSTLVDKFCDQYYDNVAYFRDFSNSRKFYNS